MSTQVAKEYMLEKIHRYHRKDKWVNTLYQAIGEDIENAGDKYQQDYNNMFFDTCDTNGAAVYEKDLAINEVADDLATRRIAIQSAWLSKCFASIPVIQAIADQFYGENIVKIGYADGEVVYNPVIHGELPKFEKFLKAVEEIKPAHLGNAWSWHYVKWGDFVKGVDRCRYITWEEVGKGKWADHAIRKWNKLYADITTYRNVTWGDLYKHGTWGKVRTEDIE